MPKPPTPIDAEPPGLPREWYTVTGYDAPPVRVGDGRVIAREGGGVRILAGGAVDEQPPLIDVKSWRLHVPLDAGRGAAVTGLDNGAGDIAGDGGPTLGYGVGGVYALDGSLRPASVLIPSPPPEFAGNPPLSVALLATGGRTEGAATLCLHLPQTGRRDPFGSRAGALQVWSLNGTRLIREVPATATGGGEIGREPARLSRLGDGYLFAGGELAWVPDDPARPVWRFDLHLARPTPSGRTPGAAHRDDDELGPPVVVGDRLYAAARGGGVYCFSIPAITGGAER